MEIARNREKENELMERIKNNWEERERDGFALFEILNPRKAFFSRTDPQPLTDVEIMTFMTGKSIEKGLLKLLGYDHGESRQVEGIWYAPDIRMPEITEIKSRRRFLPKEGEEHKEFDNYINQHLSYCALENDVHGYLGVISLVEKDGNTTRPEFAIYEVRYTVDELREKREALLVNRRLLEDALEAGDFSGLPSCPDWMCGKKTRHMVSKPYCVTCNRPFSTDYHVWRHAKSKRHVVKGATYEWAYEKRCKWFDKCNPFGEGSETFEGTLDFDGLGGDGTDEPRCLEQVEGTNEETIEGNEE